MPDFIAVAAIPILTLKVIDFLRYARARDLNGVLTQLCVWAAGILVLLLAAQTDLAGSVMIGSFTLHKLGVWSLVFYGMSAGSTASVGNDLRKAVDAQQSAAIPPLVSSGGAP